MPANTHIRDHEPMLPDTPPGRQLTAFLDALNSGDSTVMHRFMETCYDLSHLGSFMDAWHKWCGATLYHKTGGLQPQSIEESSVGKIVIRAQPRAPVCALPAGLRVTIEVAAEGPHKITDVWAWPDPPPADASVDIRGRRLAYT